LLSPRAETTEHLAGFLLLDYTMRHVSGCVEIPDYTSKP